MCDWCQQHGHGKKWYFNIRNFSVSVMLLVCVFSNFDASHTDMNTIDVIHLSESFVARVIWEYRETPDFFSSICGDADRLPNGNTLITLGTSRRVIEVTDLGEKVWEVTFDNCSYPWDYVLYRAERADIDLTKTSLYNISGWETPFEITVTVWSPDKAFNGITFVELWGTLWAINMTGSAVWKYEGYWYEQKLLSNNHLLLLHLPAVRSEIREIDLNGTMVYSFKPNCYAHHDVLKIGNRYLVSLLKAIEEINGTPVKGDIIKIFDMNKDKIVWKWDVFEYLQKDHYCPICLKEKDDWTHSNSLSFRVEKDRKVLYLSVRNLNQIVKIDVETREIIWILGEKGNFRMFEMNGTEVSKLFSHQHDPEILPNGNILLFDNGYHRERVPTSNQQPYSRAIEIKLEIGEF